MTKIVGYKKNKSVKGKFRLLSEEEFIENHGSGSLRKAKKLGMAYKSFYLEERVAYEFGWEFVAVPASRVTTGIVMAEGDCSVITELGWHVERMRTLNEIPEDVFECKYISYTNEEDVITEGVGIYLSQTSAPWLPNGKAVFALFCEWDKEAGAWKTKYNPF